MLSVPRPQRVESLEQTGNSNRRPVLENPFIEYEHWDDRVIADCDSVVEATVIRWTQAPAMPVDMHSLTVTASREKAVMAVIDACLLTKEATYFVVMRSEHPPVRR